jgi:hypothetical protein
MQLSRARIVATVGALVVVGFELTVVFGDPTSAPTARGIVIIYGIAAAAILLLPRRGAAWVATAITVPTGLFTILAFVLSPLLADGLILLLVTLMLGAAALALHREASKKVAAPASEPQSAAAGQGGYPQLVDGRCPNCGQVPAPDRTWLCNHCGAPFSRPAVTGDPR